MILSRSVSDATTIYTTWTKTTERAWIQKAFSSPLRALQYRVEQLSKPTAPKAEAQKARANRKLTNKIAAANKKSKSKKYKPRPIRGLDNIGFKQMSKEEINKRSK